MLIFEPLVAVSVLSIGRSVRQNEADNEERGIIDTVDPVSTRNDVIESIIKKIKKIEVGRLEQVEDETTGEEWEWFSLPRWLTRCCCF